MQNGNFYLLKITDKGLSAMARTYDTMRECVIIATSPLEARKIARENAGDEGKDIWLKKEFVSCKLIGTWQFSKPKLILKSCVNG